MPTTHVRILPKSAELLETLRHIVNAIDKEMADGLPQLRTLRRGMGRRTNADLLHVALDAAIETLDPDGTRRDVLIPADEGLNADDPLEVDMEIEHLIRRLSRLQMELSKHYHADKGKAD